MTIYDDLLEKACEERDALRAALTEISDIVRSYDSGLVMHSASVVDDIRTVLERAGRA